VTPLRRSNDRLFRALGQPEADRQQPRALLAARIIGVLADRKLTMRAASVLTGYAASDLCRIRTGRFSHFAIDRLMLVLSAPGQQVKMRVSVRPRRAGQATESIAENERSVSKGPLIPADGRVDASLDGRSAGVTPLVARVAFIGRHLVTDSGLAVPAGGLAVRRTCSKSWAPTD
jgi:predicted XRE-type DNA-binding protein